MNLPLAQAIDRFLQNEANIEQFTQGSDVESYRTRAGADVPSVRMFLKALRQEVLASFPGTSSQALISRIDLAIEQLRDTVIGKNYFYNPDMDLGDGGVQVLPNDALDVVGIKNFVSQQCTINPWMSVRRSIAQDGSYAIRVTNGIPCDDIVTVAYGDVSFTPGPNVNFVPGIDITAAYAEDVTIKMSGIIKSYVNGVLTINVTSVSGGGTHKGWVLGRVGTTKQAQTKILTTAPTNAGSDVLTLQNTVGVQVGANIESAGDGKGGFVNGIPKATHVVKILSPTTVLMSRKAVTPPGAPTGMGVVANQQITFYGNQGVFVYQNLETVDMRGLKYGTPDAKDSYLSFNIKSRFISGVASIMYLGYESLYELGATYVEAYPVTEQMTRQTVRIKGDKFARGDTWNAGYDVKNGFPFAGLGWALESQGTETAQNIPVGQWSEVFAVGGSDQQTLDLGSVVGAWVEISNPKYELLAPTAYQGSDTLRSPIPDLHMRAIANPRILFEGSRNAAGTKKGQIYLDGEGHVVVQALNDAETVGSNLLKIYRDGTLQLLGYPEGLMTVGPGGFVGLQPLDDSDDFVIQVDASVNPNAISYGTRVGTVQKIGKRIYVAFEVQYITVGSGGGVAIMSLPQGFPSNKKAWFLHGKDTAKTGKALEFYIPPNSTVAYVRNMADGSFPAVDGSLLCGSGFYETL